MKKYFAPEVETVELNLVNSLLNAAIGENASPTEGPGVNPGEGIDPGGALGNESPIWDDTQKDNQ